MQVWENSNFVIDQIKCFNHKKEKRLMPIDNLVKYKTLEPLQHITLVLVYSATIFFNVKKVLQVWYETITCSLSPSTFRVDKIMMEKKY
jgi:hypothetical protein